MSKQDYYDLLGIQRDAAADEIKRAYRKQAMKYHPDRNQGDNTAEQKFKDVNEAYDILRDDEKRAAYDRFGHAAFEGGGNARGAGGDFGFGGGFADIFGEMFGDIMGRGAGGQQRAARGADLRYNMQISLEDAYKGKEAQIRVPTSENCSECGGNGAAKGSKPTTCSTCKGHGKVRTQQGFFTIERTCPNCHGNGRVIENPCGGCGGSGRVRQEKTLSVNIPPGVEDGVRIRLANEGEAGIRNASPGDLYIFLAVAAHRLFQRDGANIHCRVPIPMMTATIGGSIEVPTVAGGRARVSIPAGTQSGHQFRLRGKGMPVMQSTAHGDMYIQAVIETPVNLSRRQRELLEEFTRLGSDAKQSPESEGFFSRVKEFWDDLRE